MPLDTASLNQLMPFGAHLGLDLVSATPEEVVATLSWRAELCTAGGLLHGGALMGLTDSVGGVVAFLNLPEGVTTSTISSSSVFLRGAREGLVTATGRRLHRGRSTIVVETTVTDEQGRALVRTTQTQAVLVPTS
ncbi:PaaI family thioesterase [Nocardioides terrisoli]|uniref:PaaI family thioesterase n=1 Tax=Nocardioides terrisoli TaxID=3388267 RepID=UPI00287B5F20|nr:PaaI family thioesterase [Nocardioides marmorisolisilvae]